MRFWYTAFVDFEIDKLTEIQWSILEDEIDLIRTHWPNAKVELNRDGYFKIGYSNKDMTLACAQNIQFALLRFSFIKLK